MNFAYFSDRSKYFLSNATSLSVVDEKNVIVVGMFMKDKSRSEARIRDTIWI